VGGKNGPLAPVRKPRDHASRQDEICPGRTRRQPQSHSNGSGAVAVEARSPARARPPATGARFADNAVEEAVRIYVQGLPSYQVLAAMLERLGVSVSRFTLNSWVLELGARAKSPLEVSIELAPMWGGFLGIDG
jgi:hypothetical protein